MSSAKKGKKAKGKSFSLGEFLGPSYGNSGSAVVPQKSSWAEESENYEDERFSTQNFVLPTAPRQARGPSIDPDRVPNSPPFIAYVANLPFEVDDSDIARFFNGLKIVSIRLPREGGDSGRFKGFGYVEFETRTDLLEALNNDDALMNNRKIRVDIAEEEKSSGRRDGGSRKDDDREDRSGGVSDWRAAPRDSGARSPMRERYDDRLGDRDRDRGYGDRNRGYGDRDRGYGDRDRGYSDRDRGYGDRDRGYSDRDRGYGDRDRGYGDRDRGYGDRDRGYGDRDRGYGDRDRGYSDRDRNYGRDRGYGDRGYRSYGQDRDRYDKDSDGRYGGGSGRSGSYRQEETKQRPKLNLKPRSKPAEDVATTENTPASAPNPSIFGAAKPVDTAQKELEIERKLIEGKDQKEPSKREVHTVPAADIFGNAKPVDTASREREIEQKIKRHEQPVTPTPRRDDRDSHTDGKRPPLKVDKRSSRPRTQTSREREEMQNERNKSYTRNSEEENDRHSSNSSDTKSEKGERRESRTKTMKGKIASEEDLIINTTNKFSHLELEEEEA